MRYVEKSQIVQALREFPQGATTDDLNEALFHGMDPADLRQTKIWLKTQLQNLKRGGMVTACGTVPAPFGTRAYLWRCA